jgi:methionine synthase II (cobalamin-independent)
MKKEHNLNIAETQALNIPVVICRTSFAGTISKNQFYLILEHIDRLKQDGFKFEKHKRVDNPDKITYDYVLCLYGL